MVRKPSPFNLFSNLGRGGTTGGSGATGGGVWIGTGSVLGKVDAYHFCKRSRRHSNASIEKLLQTDRRVTESLWQTKTSSSKGLA
ncbi:hypothetical protein H5410_002746 [Solanum commersonii]|uniref:Uncharacterized protein n=1 Tax=Solanum commersonii TaxID=4109 RepID=A0A9J6B2Q0_SOLCO|nr:hypothetical protein H5410_002746 [Solanum commersonii]